MKMFIFAFTALLAAPGAKACSELGAQDFAVSKEIQKTCGEIALRYATQFARLMVTTEKSEADYAGPRGKWKPEDSPPKLYLAQKRAGNSRLIGFNVGLDSGDKFECNFCVDLSLDEKGNCRIESIRKHMCAK